MNSVKENLQQVLSELPKHVTLVAVSKTKPAVFIQEAYNQGHKTFGENRAMEMVEKHESLPQDISWHMIGHLQTNKVKYIAPFVHLIHGVDSYKLLKEIDKQGAKFQRKIPCLLQFHIAQESSKFGFTWDEAIRIFDDGLREKMQNIQFSGVMGMATHTSDSGQVREEFASLKMIFERLKEKEFRNSVEFNTLSMGMSGDYKIAIDEGSNMVRIGSKIFGSRN